MTRNVRASTVLLGLGLGLAALVPAAAAVALGTAHHAHIYVSPSSGGATTRFGIRFRDADRTGRYAGTERRYELSVSGRSAAQGCVSSVSRQLADTRVHARVRVTLDPSKLGGHWCAGTFRGEITEIEAPVCRRGVACPALVVLLGTVGKFSFVVKPLPGADDTPPRFAGLESAVACTPGPQRPGQTTPFTLSWRAASDNVTPSSQIAYDVYESGKAGGENFASPSWKTSPGVTTFRTPGLPSHGTFYFVVRARDRAGNEDHNRVERLGSDPCL